MSGLDKQRVNLILTRISGYHLTKGAPGEERAKARAQRRRLEQQLERARESRRAAEHSLQVAEDKLAAAAAARKAAAEAAAAAAAARKAEGEVFPPDFDDEMREIITACAPFTMTKSPKLHALVSATRYIAAHQIPGDIVECGVWRGGSMHAVARTLAKAGDLTRELYLFDTFEGMTAPSDRDLRHDGESAASLLETTTKTGSIWAVATLDDVKSGFAQVPYPAERLHFIKGKVEDTIPEQLPERISILRLDTDWYESTAHELTHMYDRLVPGGVLMIDDYGHWAGSRAATDEFLARTGAKLLLLRMGTGRVAVKPGL